MDSGPNRRKLMKLRFRFLQCSVDAALPYLLRYPFLEICPQCHTKSPKIKRPKFFAGKVVVRRVQFFPTVNIKISTDNSHVVILTFSLPSLLCVPLAACSVLDVFPRIKNASIFYPVFPPSSLGANQKQDFKVALTVILVTQPINEWIQTAVDENQ